ncbi:uncharacterized protein LOC132178565 [Corylus avellana]|uniref:uncharacterized protein LOC132178565 n=1 Tax=Corylus avellana TaxID=13451 RepID=UPI00286BE51C|nr:uncharacterized protein LOC132178565 [Corylus avellana]
MASPKGIHDEATEDSDLTFPAADVDKELHPGENQNFEGDPISSEVATSSENKKEQAELEQKKKEKRKKEALQTLKTTILVSAAIVAVAGVVCAVTKKLREK